MCLSHLSTKIKSSDSSFEFQTGNSKKPVEIQFCNPSPTVAQADSGVIECSLQGQKPKRPLSAYNLFFQSERRNILGACPYMVTEHKNGKTRRTHGKIGFAALARSIAAKWKNLDPATRSHFASLAAKEKQAYHVKKRLYVTLKSKCSKLRAPRQVQRDDVSDEFDGSFMTDSEPTRIGSLSHDHSIRSSSSFNEIHSPMSRVEVPEDDSCNGLDLHFTTSDAAAEHSQVSLLPHDRFPLPSEILSTTYGFQQDLEESIKPFSFESPLINCYPDVPILDEDYVTQRMIHSPSFPHLDNIGELAEKLDRESIDLLLDMFGGGRK